VDFEVSEEQELLRKGLREMLERECPPSRVRQSCYEGDGSDPALWQALAAAGWTGLTVPEGEGGAGLRFEDLVPVVEQAGRAILHVPLATTLLAARAIAAGPQTPQHARVLTSIVSGEVAATFALHGYSGGDCRAEPAGTGFVLTGEHSLVPHGPLATHVLAEARDGDGRPALFLVRTDTPGLAWTDVQYMDRSVRQFEGKFDGVTADTEALLASGEEARELVGSLLDEWRVALSAESLGACETALTMSVEYARNRVQFGRPIGSNQAVKARIAEMAAALDRLRVAVYYAAWAIDAGSAERAAAVALAKSAGAGPASWVASEAIHVHGGIGFTWEHDLHMYFKRVKSNELLLGDGTESLERLAEAVL
jgi:alkylation response protein AidB-like acyl-CoA dehydrogenase